MAKKVTKRATKKELGLGIRAVFGNNTSAPRTKEEKEELVKELTNTVADIPIEKIKANSEQPRVDFDQDSLNELAKSIKRYGVLQPITVQSMGDGTFKIISGERRWRASQIAGLTEIPAYVITSKDEQHLFEMALIENVQREDLNPMELAMSFGRLKDTFKLSDIEIADRVGKGRATITNYLRLLKLDGNDTNIKEDLISGAISMGHARCLVGLDAPYRQDFYNIVAERNLSVRELEALIKKHNEQKAPNKLKKSNALPTAYETVQRDLRQRFGSKKIAIKLQKDGKGQIVLPFSSTDELNRFLDLMEE